MFLCEKRERERLLGEGEGEGGGGGGEGLRIPWQHLDFQSRGSCVLHFQNRKEKSLISMELKCSILSFSVRKKTHPGDLVRVL